MIVFCNKFLASINFTTAIIMLNQHLSYSNKFVNDEIIDDQEDVLCCSKLSPFPN